MLRQTLGASDFLLKINIITQAHYPLLTMKYARDLHFRVLLSNTMHDTVSTHPSKNIIYYTIYGRKLRKKILLGNLLILFYGQQGHHFIVMRNFLQLSIIIRISFALFFFKFVHLEQKALGRWSRVIGITQVM